MKYTNSDVKHKSKEAKKRVESSKLLMKTATAAMVAGGLIPGVVAEVPAFDEVKEHILPSIPLFPKVASANEVNRVIGYSEEFNKMIYASFGTKVNSNVGGVLNITSTNNDPMLYMEHFGKGSFDPAILRYVEFRYRILSDKSTYPEIFFTNDKYPIANADARVGGPLFGSYGL